MGPDRRGTFQEDSPCARAAAQPSSFAAPAIEVTATAASPVPSRHDAAPFVLRGSAIRPRGEAVMPTLNVSAATGKNSKK